MKKDNYWVQAAQRIVDPLGTHIEIENNLANEGAEKTKLQNQGVTIVLTASDIEMSDFNLNPFMAFAGGFPHFLVRKKLYPSLTFNPDGSAKFAPYGLRKVESLLIDGFGEKNVVVTHPSNLHLFVGPFTKVIGITTMDPLGIGFVSRTYTGLLGLNGKPATLAEFEDLMEDPALKQTNAKIIVGGAGAWQIPEAKMQDAFGIDTVVLGQSEHSLIDIFRRAMAGEDLERVITSPVPSGEEVPLIKNPSLYGTVEVMRGCGRGCSFCSPTLRQRYSFSKEHIMKEVELNARNDTKMIILQTDDLFLYQAKPHFIPNKEAISNLILEVSKIDSVKYLQVAHASLAPIVHDPSLLDDIAPVLVEKSTWTCGGVKCASVEVGIETGSSRLMDRYMRGKMLPYSPEQWQDIVIRSIKTMNENKVCPLATLILGLPGEQDDDVLATVELLNRLDDLKLFYVPLLFTSEEESGLKHHKHENLKDLSRPHWDIISRCWKYNINVWKPEMNRTIAMASIISSPFYMIKHGTKVIGPIMKISGLEDALWWRRSSVKCQPQLCTTEPEVIKEGQSK